MELRQIEYFLAVIDHEGLNRAAQALGVAEPSVSQGVRSLERELKVPLFLRTGRRLTPSPTGVLLVPLARQLLRDRLSIQDAMARARTLEDGALSVAAMPEMSSDGVAAWSAGFLRAHPGIRIDIHEVAGLRELSEEILRGRCELGFSILPLDRDDLETIPLGMQRLLLVSPPGTGLSKRGRPVPLGDLAGLPFVISHAASRENDLVATALRDHDVDVDVRATVPNRTTQFALVRDLGLHTLLPMRMAAQAAVAGAEVAETEPVVETSFGIVRRKGAASPAADGLIEGCKRALDEWYAGIDAYIRSGSTLVEAAVAAQRDLGAI